MRAALLGIFVSTSLSGCLISREELRASDVGLDTRADAWAPDASVDARRVVPNADTGPDAFVPLGVCAGRSAGAVCRASMGACDAAEACDGVSADCPIDVRRSGACRAGSECDPAESCSGGVECPPDLRAPVGAGCTGGVCDDAGSCNPCEEGMPCDSGVPCAAAVIRCATGAPVCMETGNAPDGTACASLTSDGPCSGPSECQEGLCVVTYLSGEVCRAAAGLCDVAERCDGSGPACPPNAVHDAMHVCRPRTGTCDAPERCNGSGSNCPMDRNEPNRTPCNMGMDQCCDGVCRRGMNPC